MCRLYLFPIQNRQAFINRALETAARFSLPRAQRYLRQIMMDNVKHLQACGFPDAIVDAEDTYLARAFVHVFEDDYGNLNDVTGRKCAEWSERGRANI